MRRAAPAVQHVRSPLTRAGYTLAAGASHLLLLAAGRADLRPRGEDPRRLADGPRLIWRADGNGDELILQGGTRALLLTLPAMVVSGALPATPLGEQMASTLRQELNLPHDTGGRIGALVDGLEAEQQAEEPGADLAQQQYVALLLVHLWRLARADLIAHGRAPQGLAERFVALAGKHLRDHLRVGDYAAALGVSRDRLGSAVRRATGVSPQLYLHRLLLREASELLANTGMPISQVAFRLGFSDPAYFTRFFIRLSGETPAHFRRHAKDRLPTTDHSFAAWP